MDKVTRRVWDETGQVQQRHSGTKARQGRSLMMPLTRDSR